MKRLGLVPLLLLVVAVLAWWSQPSSAQSAGRVQWIWHDEGEPTKAAPVGTRLFRQVFTINRNLQKPVAEEILEITTDNAFKVWVNGKLVGRGDDWKRVQSFDVQPLLVHGHNVIAVEPANTEGAAGILVRLGYVPNGQSKLALVSDGTWKSSTIAARSWQAVDFTEEGWKAVRVLGPYGQTAPWNKVLWDRAGNEHFTVPEGFRVEEVVKIPEFDKTFSLVNLCFDDRGRLLVSRESGRARGIDRGHIYLCTNPDKNSVLQTVKSYCTQVTSCQGMCRVGDALFLMGDGPEGTGLYCVPDLEKDDRPTRPQLLHRCQGGYCKYLLRGVESNNPLVRSEALAALLKLTEVIPRVEDAGPHRQVLSSIQGMTSDGERWTIRVQTITGLAAVQGDTVTVLLNDATRVTLKKDEIESQVASLVSVMPERLLDALTREEIADLFAYLESEPK